MNESCKGEWLVLIDKEVEGRKFALWGGFRDFWGLVSDPVADYKLVGNTKTFGGLTLSQDQIQAFNCPFDRFLSHEFVFQQNKDIVSEAFQF